MRAEQVDDLPGACWNSAATSAARTVTNTMGSAPVEVASGPDTAARMTPTARRNRRDRVGERQDVPLEGEFGKLRQQRVPEGLGGDAGVVGDEEHRPLPRIHHAPCRR